MCLLLCFPFYVPLHLFLFCVFKGTSLSSVLNLFKTQASEYVPVKSATLSGSLSFQFYKVRYLVLRFQNFTNTHTSMFHFTVITEFRVRVNSYFYARNCSCLLIQPFTVKKKILYEKKKIIE